MTLDSDTLDELYERMSDAEDAISVANDAIVEAYHLIDRLKERIAELESEGDDD